MRYSDSGGLTVEGRARREKVRLQAAQVFAPGIDAEQVAKCLRGQYQVGIPVAAMLACGRRGGEAALASKGPGGNVCKLDQAQLARLRAALDLGPAGVRLETGPAVDAGPGHGADRAAFSRALHAARRLVPAAPDRFSPQVPAHGATERDEAAIAAWRAET